MRAKQLQYTAHPYIEVTKYEPPVVELYAHYKSKDGKRAFLVLHVPHVELDKAKEREEVVLQELNCSKGKALQFIIYATVAEQIENGNLVKIEHLSW